MAKDNMEKIADLGIASRGGEAGQYHCGDYVRGLAAHGKLTRGVDATSGYQFGDITRGLFAEQAVYDEAEINHRVSQRGEELRAKLEAAEKEAAEARAEVEALRAGQLPARSQEAAGEEGT